MLPLDKGVGCTPSRIGVMRSGECEVRDTKRESGSDVVDVTGGRTRTL